MRFSQKLGTVIAAFAMAMVVSSKADAALLTINDNTDVWTLDVETGCTQCDIILKVVYGNPTARSGSFLDAVQWDLTTPNVNPTTIGFTGFTSTSPAASGTWTFVEANLNANQCGGGSQNAICGSFSGGTAAQQAAGGFGAIVAGSTLTWTFDSTFASTLTSVGAGNIRAAYNTANGTNAGIFSPGGGNFTGAGAGGGGGAGQTVPEPASLVLFGAAMLGVAYRARNRRK